MDREDLEIAIAEALGKATAFLAMQIALTSTLIARGIISEGDAATMTGAAEQIVETIQDLSDDARRMALGSLRGYAAALTRHVTKN